MSRMKVLACAGALLIGGSSVFAADNMTGALRISTQDVAVNTYPGNRSYLQAATGIRISNEGKAPLRLALMKLSLQLDGDSITFDTKSFDGVGNCFNGDVTSCDRHFEKFEVIQGGQVVFMNVSLQARVGPRQVERAKSGRLSGSLYVRNQETGKSWPAPISIESIPVNMKVP